VDINQIMSPHVVTVEADDTLDVVRNIFERATFHHLLVIDSSELTGVISDRDLLRAISPRVGTDHETEQDLATLNKRAHQIMSRNPVSLRGKSTVNEAIELFCNHHISCIPVVDQHNVPIGILSWRDLLKTFLNQQ